MEEILGHGAYRCVRRSAGSSGGLAEAGRVAALAGRLELHNEFAPAATPTGESIAFLRRLGATKADIADEDVLRADAVIHVASRRGEVIADMKVAETDLLKVESIITGAAVSELLGEAKAEERPQPR